MKHNFFNLFLIVFSQIFFAQNRSAKIKSLATDGFYKIAITPEILSASKNNLDFIRIIDSRKNEVPYIIFKNRSNTKSVKSFPVLSRNAVPNKYTDFVFLNENLEKIDHINLKISNTDVAKNFNISGSNDGKEWFGLTDNQFIDGLSDPKSTFVIRDFYFPLNQYKFLKFTFIDKNSLPVNVLEAFSEASFQNNSMPVALNGFSQKIVQNKETKQTVITINFNEPQVVNAFKIDVSSPGFYLRNASLSVPKTRTYRKRTETFSENVVSFQMNSKIKARQQISNVFSKSFIITIDNQDNSPLEISKINFYQNPVALLADLKKGENYSIKIDQKLSQPQYDLASSDINLNENFPVATVENLDKIEKNNSQNTEKSIWQKPIFMWLCILVAIAIIGFFAIGLVKDMNKEKSE